MTALRYVVGLTLLCGGAACATGVDVTDGELAEICSEPGTTCGALSTPVGSAGSNTASGGQGGGAGTGGPSGGSSNAGRGGSSGAGTGAGQSGASSMAGTGGTGASTGGPATPITMPASGGCAAPAPTAVGGCATGTAVSVLYTDRSDAPTFNQMTMALDVENTGADFALTDVVLRYWFNGDGQTEFVPEIDYAPIGKENVCVSFGNQLGQSFADIGFTTSATIGAGVQDIQVRLHTPNYAQQDQANDFSFIAGATGVVNENITIYQGGTRVSGCEP